MFTDSIDDLIDSIKMVGEVYLDSNNIPNAFFAFRELRTLCMATRKDKEIIDAYLGMAECCCR